MHNHIYKYNRLSYLLPIAGITTIVFLLILSAGSAFFFSGRNLVQELLKEKLKSTAAAAAMQFSGDDLNRIYAGDTVRRSAVLREISGRLQRIRETIPNIRFVYIMRRTRNPQSLEFVADADLMLSQTEIDVNKNGVVDEEEKVSAPGDLYDISDVPALHEEAFLHPTTDTAITTDQWGSAISGYAPITNAAGQTVAVLGIDMSADDFLRLSDNIFSFLTFGLLLFAVTAIGGSILLLLRKHRIEELERLEIERNGLLRLAFHQLGGPLTIINWSIEELEDLGPPTLHRTIMNIQEGIRRLTQILKTLKEADLVHSGKIEYKAERSSLSPILEGVVHSMEKRLAIRKQTVTLSLAENIAMNLDPKLIAGVAEELLTNAIDFSPDGSRIEIRSRMNRKYAEFEIEDHGCGIPKKDIPRLFGEFTRGSNATKFKADGNGLGLYIVRGVIEHAGGNVSLESQEGVGTTVTIRLPLA